MLKKKLLLISIITIILIGIFHFLALKYSWYWSFRWIDIPMHIIGGFWVSITVLWVSLKIGHIESINGYKKKALLVILGSVLIVAIFWELFELIFKITSLHDIGYWKDSLCDILNTFIGGVVGFLYFTKNKKAKRPAIIDRKVRNNFAVI